MLAVLALLPAAARAQAVGGASISGTVKDTSGAVLPGVSVEAASPALIEKVRSVTTDASGQYKIENLRPGHVFRHVHAGRVQHGQARGHRADGHVRRHDQRRSAVGNVSETITVTDRERRSSTCRARSGSASSPRKSWTRFRPAAATSTRSCSPGCGGLPAGSRRLAGRRRHEQPAEHHVLHPRRPHQRHAPAARRRPARQRAVAGRVLELRARHRRDAGSRRSTTRAISAEQPFGGLRINIMPKEGGNTFRGSIFATGVNSGVAGRQPHATI